MKNPPPSKKPRRSDLTADCDELLPVKPPTPSRLGHLSLVWGQCARCGFPVKAMTHAALFAALREHDAYMRAVGLCHIEVEPAF